MQNWLLFSKIEFLAVSIIKKKYGNDKASQNLALNKKN